MHKKVRLFFKAGPNLSSVKHGQISGITCNSKYQALAVILEAPVNLMGKKKSLN